MLNNLKLPLQESIRPILIMGEIDSNLTFDVCKTLIETNWKNYKEIAIFINSEGGSLPDCFAIIDLIDNIKKKWKLKIKTYGLGECSSAGFFLFLLGDKRFCGPSCRFYVHEHIVITAEETYQERVNNSKEEKILHDIYSKYVAKRLNISKTRATNLLKKQKWLSNSELNRYGVLTDG